MARQLPNVSIREKGIDKHLTERNIDPALFGKFVRSQTPIEHMRNFEDFRKPDGSRYVWAVMKHWVEEYKVQHHLKGAKGNTSVSQD